MNRTTYQIQNVKCGGCGNSITKAVGDIEGISDVQVIPEENSISFSYEKELLLAEVIHVLKKLGYPLADDANTLGDKAKSYVSCMIGRVSPKN